MQTYEYIVVTADNKVKRVVADCVANVLKVLDDEEENPIINIFRDSTIIEGGVYEDATIQAEVTPPIALETGCRAFPNIPVETKQGRAITLCAVVAPGWKLDGWYSNGKELGNTTQLTTIVQDAGTVIYTARFVPAV